MPHKTRIAYRKYIRKLEGHNYTMTALKKMTDSELLETYAIVQKHLHHLPV